LEFTILELPKRHVAVEITLTAFRHDVMRSKRVVLSVQKQQIIAKIGKAFQT
jgi:hypothetical protein